MPDLLRILECETCGARSWIHDLEPAPRSEMHQWWELYTVELQGNGPGLTPTQISVTERAAHA
jgi:hypothetical protein